MIVHVKFLVLVLLCLHCNFLFVSGDVRCIKREREALLVFKQGLIDDYGILSSWRRDDNHKECCNWKGVLCSNTTGHVIGLQLGGDLSDRQLRGEVSPALLELHHLSDLNLSFNDFGGNRIPKFIGSMKILQHLDLSGSNFSGTVSHHLGNLTNLQTLDLRGNFLRFENLNWLSYLSLLSKLDLSASTITDLSWLQPTLKLRSLKELSLINCDISDVKPSVGLLVNFSSTSLSILDLSDNRLSSSVFNWLFNITSLVEIYLGENQLDGQIPDAFGKLIFLERLFLSLNELEGGIPKSLGNLSHLQRLDLSYNHLKGSVPDLSSCLALTDLNLGSNRLTGSAPACLALPVSLQSLDVSNNSLEGTISEANFMTLHNLETLDLSFNALTVQINPNWNPPFQLYTLALAHCNMGPRFPTWLRTQSSISYLDLSQAGLSQEMPKWLWDLSPKMNYLNLSLNNISGGIPDFSFGDISFGVVSVDGYIDISFNAFSGPIPSFHSFDFSVLQMSHNMFSGSILSICPILSQSIHVLDLSHNQLSGEIPSCWANAKELRSLNLNDNHFSGEVPPSLGSLSNLRSMILRNNNLSGKLPPALSKCQSLEIIDVGENRLTGNIPTWIGTFWKDMKILGFQQNEFYGSIPLELCHLTNLQVLDISRNNLSGIIPPCFINFTTLAHNIKINESIIGWAGFGCGNAVAEYFGNAIIQWKGQESEYGKTLGLLRLIDLSSNYLEGSIPQELYHLKGLVSLNLSSNQLSGQLNSNIGQMDMLDVLDLSRNHLSGGIPAGLVKLHFLSVLDLADNNFSGKIPLGTQLQSFNASVYAGNAQLCGRPLRKCPGDDPNTAISNHGKHSSAKEEDGFFMSFLGEFGISLGLGFIFGFWGFVGPLLLMDSWRNKYFNVMGRIGNWIYVTTAIFLRRLRRWNLRVFREKIWKWLSG